MAVPQAGQAQLCLRFLQVTGGHHFNEEKSLMMKRSILFAAAGLALAGAAQAQSTVTLYGLVDLNVTHFKAGSAAGGFTNTALTDGTSTGLNGSRWGLRTVEDLGGGLRAGVTMEAGVNADTGNPAQGGRAFGRQIFVWLGSDSAGELRLGRQYALHDPQQGQSNPFSNGLWLNPGFGITDMGKALPQFIDAPRIDNVIQYSLPKFGGVAASVQYAPGEGVNDNFYGVGVSYAAGPVFAGITHEWNKDHLAGKWSNKVTQVVANYDFGAVKILGGLQHATDLTINGGNVGQLSNLVVTGATTFTATRLNAYTVGASMPFGAWLVGANYIRTKYESATGQTQTLGRIALGTTYALSKRSIIYGSIGTTTGDLKDYISQKNEFQLGLRHAF
jgi:general bacterial porin, GBP family